MKISKTFRNILICTAVLVLPLQSSADSAAEIDVKAAEALNELYAESPAAKVLGDNAEALLIFPMSPKPDLV